MSGGEYKTGFNTTPTPESRLELLRLVEEELYSPTHPARKYELDHSREVAAWQPPKTEPETIGERHAKLLLSYELAKQMVRSAESSGSFAASQQREKVAGQDLKEFERAHGISTRHNPRP